MVIHFHFELLPFQRSHDAKYLAVSSQDGYSTLLEFENGELGSPFALSGLSISSIIAHSCCISPHPRLKLVFLHFEPEVKCVIGDQKKSPAEPENMEVEETKPVVTVSTDSGKREVEMKDLKEKAASNASSVSVSTRKPAKRRITPVSINLS